MSQDLVADSLRGCLDPPFDWIVDDTELQAVAGDLAVHRRGTKRSLVSNKLPAVTQAAISIVVAGASDPVGTGLFASLRQPGGNVTSLSLQQSDYARSPWQRGNNENTNGLLRQ